MGRLRAVLSTLAGLTAGVVLGLVLAPPPAVAGDVPGGGGHAQAGYVHWGDPCTTPGVTGQTRGGGTLVCVQARGDDCPRWHNASPAPAGAGWTRPSVPACPRCASPSVPPLALSASPTTSPSASPSVSVPAGAGPSSPAALPAAVGGELPVTGVPVVPLVLAGVGLVAVGLYALRTARRRPRRPVG